MAWFGEALDWYHNNGLLPGLWKGATGQLSAEQQAEENLQYQRERNSIEDARYEAETAYNHSRDALADERYADELEYSRGRDALADKRYEEELQFNRDWALDDREYNRALQQQLFEREDTAISRQANELSRLGINPLSQNMNGLGSGSVVSSAPAPSAGAPTSANGMQGTTMNSGFSSRGGRALQKNMQILDSALPLVQLAGDLSDSIQGISNGVMQRDALQLENDRKYIENKILASKNGFSYYDSRRGSKKARAHYNIEDNRGNFPDSAGVDLYKDYESIRDIKHKINSGIYGSDTDLMKTLKDFSTENYADMAEKVVTNLAQMFDKLNFFKPNL